MPSSGDARPAAIQEQAKQAVLLADEYGILRRPAETAAEFDVSGEKALVSGTEHWVDFDDTRRLVIKITRPPGFGLIPYVRSSPIIDLRNPGAAPVMRETVEFTVATPLEYLERWLDANELFSDNVRLVSVIQWGNGQVSFSITQPQYHGVPAHPQAITDFFLRAGWTSIPNQGGHSIFYNYNWQVLAIDVEPRNCYFNQGYLLPFDPILHRPGEALKDHLGLYPG
ncbi:MAG: hypothetical protein EOP86_06170 [Verrucomicrobiaceae bacterium]|nr:MAG: hypothetical protein EOP86_06170 [Verrucomicrobiaceae bacterium]